MPNVRLAIVYYSTYGTNHRMAEVASNAARDAGADVRLRKAPETAPDAIVNGQDAWRAHAERTAHVQPATLDDLEWANAYMISGPTRYGAVASQLRAFLDQTGPLWAAGKLANKAASAMASAQNVHGGQEMTVQSLNATFAHWGCVIVPPGYTDPSTYAAGGNPYGVTVTANGQAIPDAVQEAIRHQTRRLVHFAARIAEE
ncbi:NAD(P)H:quinone oxidoreductase [Gemmatimonas groenlandica]|uniref:NAD(P)H:quinone oxidoreductase n=1 Tax=Gemmatimonas groenlandica TaxID=2732249 RepID=A0A6M4IKK7_9BACT|nr:NAD(P)H:quinone oxidoreductase [Gemmatimonas groenlandica]QJR34057.1 NAD(P)H:quinone oxidoreductase [Gemmatimonas groenlandica]